VAELQAVQRHTIRVRYGECDAQGVVFNAHYLAYFDDAFDHRLRSGGFTAGATWDIMLKKAEVVWQASASVEDLLDIDVGIARWGKTSFDVHFAGSVAGEPCVECTTTYVVVTRGQPTPIPIPDELRDLLV
jgi:acyl-CoA thioester hydrolase